MDLQDPLLDDADPTKESAAIKVVPVTERTYGFLNDAFTSKMSGADRRAQRSKYTLPQNDLTRVPFLGAIMASECSRNCKSILCICYKDLSSRQLDHSANFWRQSMIPTLKSPWTKLGKLLRRLLANTSNKTSLMRRTKILEEYNKELVTFAQAKESGKVQLHVCLNQNS